MGATFQADLPSNKDWVRLLLGDTDMSDVALEDETIEAIIAEDVAKNGSGAWTKYLAAALAGRIVAARWESSSSGITSKKVGDLTLDFGDSGGSASKQYDDYLCKLRERGAELLLLHGRRPAVFKAL